MRTTLPLNMLEPLPVRVRAITELDADAVARYTDVYRDDIARKEMEPPVVFREPGCDRYVVTDGEHRVEAAKRANLTEIEVELREGDQFDALAFALSCNVTHGLPRREIDTWHTFCVLMDTPELRARFRTDQERADAMCVSRRTVTRYKADYRDSMPWAHMTPAERRKRLKARRAQERQQREEQRVDGVRVLGEPGVDPRAGEVGESLGYADRDEDGSDRVRVRFPDGAEENIPPHMLVPAEPNDTTKPKRERKGRERVELTAEQKRVAKNAREDAKRQRLDQANRKTFEEGLSAIRAIPHDGAEAARRWTDIDIEQVRYVREWCDQFIRAREEKEAA